MGRLARSMVKLLDTKTLRYCFSCQSRKRATIANFYKRSAAGLSRECRNCRDARTIKWHKANPERVAASRRKRQPARELKYKYGMTLAQYEVLLSKQSGVCAICGEAPTKNRLVVDHCHINGVVRGLLCSGCNCGLGFFKDNAEKLVRAAEYLRSATV